MKNHYCVYLKVGRDVYKNISENTINYFLLNNIIK